MADVFGVPTVVIGGGAGVIVMVALLWYFFSRSGANNRLSMERQEIQEDRELLKLDKQTRHIERDEKFRAKQLKNLFIKIDARARSIGLKAVVNERISAFQYVMAALDAVVKERTNVLGEESLLRKLYSAINMYLKDFPPQDPEVSILIMEIKEFQSKLYQDITREDALLNQKEALLRKEYTQTRGERGA